MLSNYFFWTDFMLTKGLFKAMKDGNTRVAEDIIAEIGSRVELTRLLIEWKEC